jgi:hypothetical protein
MRHLEGQICHPLGVPRRPWREDKLKSIRSFAKFLAKMDAA